MKNTDSFYDEQNVRIAYKNHRGRYTFPLIAPLRLFFGVTEWHPEPQWFLHATDVEKGEERSYALKDVGRAPTIALTQTESAPKDTAFRRWRRGVLRFYATPDVWLLVVVLALVAVIGWWH